MSSSPWRKTLEGKPDAKLAKAVKIVKQLLADGFQPIVFCRFIDTAKYVAEELDKALGRNTTVAVVTGELPPEERTARIDELGAASTATGSWSQPTASAKVSTCRTSSRQSFTTTWPGTPPGTSSARAASTASDRRPSESAQ